MLGASVVAQGWSQYFVTFLDQLGVTWPESVGPGSHFDLPAFLLIAALTLLIAMGIKESLRVNLVLVGVKLFIVLFVIFAGIQFINRDNWSPFIPPSQPGKAAEGLTTPLLQVHHRHDPDDVRRHGHHGRRRHRLLRLHRLRRRRDDGRGGQEPAARPAPSASSARSPSARCSTSPSRSSSPACQNYKDIDPEAALATAFKSVGKDGYATLISAGAVAGLTTVVMTLIIGATRVTFAMSRDRLHPGRARPDQPAHGHARQAHAHHRHASSP